MKDALESAVLCKAVYAKNLKTVPENKITKELKTDSAEFMNNFKSLTQGGFSDVEAVDFLKKYKIYHEYDSSSGLQMALFEDRNGKKTVAVAGTNDFKDFMTDFNLFRAKEHLTKEVKGILNSARNVVKGWHELGFIESGEKYKLTGHSLGGYISHALSFMCSGEEVSALHTFNSPMPSDVGLTKFYPTCCFGKEVKPKNFYAEAGLNVTSDLHSYIKKYPEKYGEYIPIFIEGTSYQIEGHYIQRLVESLYVLQFLSDIGVPMTAEQFNQTAKCCCDGVGKHSLKNMVDMISRGIDEKGSTDKPRPKNLYDMMYQVRSQIKDKNIRIRTVFDMPDIDEYLSSSDARRQSALYEAVQSFSPFVFEKDGRVCKGQLSVSELQKYLMKMKQKIKTYDTRYMTKKAKLDELSSDV